MDTITQTRNGTVEGRVKEDVLLFAGIPYALAEQMHDAWIAFVRDGSPETSTQVWPRFGAERRTVMEFGDEIGTRDDPRPNSRAVWDGVR